MVFGSEAVLLANIAFRLPRVENHDEEKSDEARELEINCAEEQHLDTCARTSKCHLIGFSWIGFSWSRIGFSWSAIWFCVGNRRQKASTSYHRIGRAPIWSRRSLDLYLIGCVISTESTSQTCGTSTSLGASMLEASLNKDMCSFCIPSIQ
jgi:hypothetical protein